MDDEGGTASMAGVVASAHRLASEAGASILRGGGNAFDAAIGVAACLNVVEPYMSGLAGMGYATMWVAAERRVRVLDFVSSVPRSFPVERFSSRDQLARGPLSVGPPASLAGWLALWQAYGSLPLDHLLDRAIVLATDGFEVGRFGAEEITQHAPALASDSCHGEAFRSAYPFGAGIAAGATVQQPHLAATLRQIGTHGAGILYDGVLGRRVVDHVQAVGGTLAMNDLADVQAVWREPVSVAYRGMLVHAPPPPCEGFQFLLTLRLLAGFDIAALGRETAGHLDLVIRAIRIAASVRIQNDNPPPERLDELLSDGTVEALRARLRAGAGLQGPTEQWTLDPLTPEDPGHTTSFSVADRDGNIVCVTQSLGSVFGSGVVVPGTGICLNNFLHWADVQPGSPNRTAPGRALPMCMAPSISTQAGSPVLALGTPGSYGILQTQAQAMVSHLDFGLDLQAAIDAPRGRLWDGDTTDLEDRIAPGVIAALRGLGHDARPLGSAWSMKVGGMQAIRRDAASGLLTGAADRRRDGAVVAL